MSEIGKHQRDLSTLINSKNVAELLTQGELDELSKATTLGYLVDMNSRSDWEQRNADAIKLAVQTREVKNFPWTNCSNVKFPLLTIAALQFLARVAVMTKGRGIAKVEVRGPDPKGRKTLQARRLSAHISAQLLEEDVNWMDSDEQAKLSASILGSAFKKTYPDPLTGKVLSEHIPAMDLVMDYFCKDVRKAERITQVLRLSANTVQEKVRQGLFLEGALDLDPAMDASLNVNLLKATADQAEGIYSPEDASDISPLQVLEQHCWLDLDGDGYKEPYVVTAHQASGKILRVVARFFDSGDVYRLNDGKVREIEAQLLAVRALAVPDMAEESRLEKEAERLQHAAGNKIIRIEPLQYFTRYLFIPSPDGGVYGLGLGALLGPVNETCNTLINQLIDAGTMSVTAGGFLGRGVKIKAGKNTFDPFEWKVVDSPGNDLKANIVPLPVREPSAVLFQLLGMLVSYGEKIGSATDAMTGVNPGQNTPAETSRNTVEQGMMLFSGIYNRMYRSFREEIEKFYEFNKLYLEYSPRWAELTQGDAPILAIDDYRTGGFFIKPACSPEAVSQSQQREKAGLVRQAAASEPGFNRYVAMRRFLEAWDIDGIEELYPDPQGPNAIAPPQNPKVELEKAKLQQAAKEHEDEMKLEVAQLQDQLRLTEAKIAKLQAEAAKQLAQADGVGTGHEIAMIEAQIGAAKAHRDGMLKSIEMTLKAVGVHQQNKLQAHQMRQEGHKQKALEAGAAPEDGATPALTASPAI